MERRTDFPVRFTWCEERRYGRKRVGKPVLLYAPREVAFCVCLSAPRLRVRLPPTLRPEPSRIINADLGCKRGGVPINTKQRDRARGPKDWMGVPLSDYFSKSMGVPDCSLLSLLRNGLPRELGFLG